MKKNVASQVIVAQLVSATDGSAVTSGTTTVYVLGDGGTQATGTGTVTHEGNGCWSYVPSQAETNYDHIAFTFANTSAVSVTVQVYTTFPQTGDTYGSLPTNFPSFAITAGGAVTAGTVSDKTGYSLTQTFPTNFADMAITATTGYVSVGTNNDKTGYSISGTTTTLDALQTHGDSNWATATGFSTLTAAEVWSYATRVLTAGTNLNDITAADVWAATTRTLSAGTNLNDISVSDVLTTAMTESYAANGVAPTLAQALFAIHQFLMNSNISGTDWIVTKLDKTTTAFSATLNDPLSPTGVSR